MTRPWEAEHVVDRSLAKQLIETQHPTLAPARVEDFGVGWDNTAYLVDDAFVFRFPRRTVAVELLENEARVLPAIARKLPLPIPVPTLAGAPARGYPWPFWGYRLLPGRTADRVRLDDDQRERAAAPLGAFLRALHDLDPTSTGAPPDTWARADMKKRAPELCDRLDSLERAGVLDDATPWRQLIARTPPPPVSDDARLCHGDLYARHVLVDDAGVPCGVIDWGDVNVGDPAMDLAIVFAFLPASARPAFFEVYGELDERTRDLARLRALFSAVAIAWYGYDTGDHALLDEGKAGLGYILEE